MSPRRDRPEPPRLRAGQHLTRADLANAAYAALEAADITHDEAAARLGVNRTAITRAVNPDHPAGVKLCAQIIEMCTDYRLDADSPLYRVERKQTDAP